MAESTARRSPRRSRGEGAIYPTSDGRLKPAHRAGILAFELDGERRLMRFAGVGNPLVVLFDWKDG